jgi:hypothetical protein
MVRCEVTQIFICICAYMLLYLPLRHHLATSAPHLQARPHEPDLARARHRSYMIDRSKWAAMVLFAPQGQRAAPDDPGPAARMLSTWSMAGLERLYADLFQARGLGGTLIQGRVRLSPWGGDVFVFVSIQLPGESGPLETARPDSPPKPFPRELLSSTVLTGPQDLVMHQDSTWGKHLLRGVPASARRAELHRLRDAFDAVLARASLASYRRVGIMGRPPTHCACAHNQHTAASCPD